MSNRWYQLDFQRSEIPTEPKAAALIYGILLQKLRFNYRQNCIFLDFVEDLTTLLDLLVVSAAAAAGSVVADRVRNEVRQIDEIRRTERRLNELEQFRIVLERDGGFRDDAERCETCRVHFREADEVIDRLRELCACGDDTRKRLVLLGERLAEAVYRSDLEEFVVLDCPAAASNQSDKVHSQAQRNRSADHLGSLLPMGWRSIRCAEAPAPRNWLDLVRIEWVCVFRDDRGRPREVPAYLIEPSGLADYEIAAQRIVFLKSVLCTAVSRLSAAAKPWGLAVEVIDSKVYLIRNASGEKLKIGIGKGAERTIAEELIKAGEEGRSRTELEDVINSGPATEKHVTQRKKAVENALCRLRSRGLGKLGVEVTVAEDSASGSSRYRFAVSVRRTTS